MTYLYDITLVLNFGSQFDMLEKVKGIGGCSMVSSYIFIFDQPIDPQFIFLRQEIPRNPETNRVDHIHFGKSNEI
jgi:hypothetical protein